MRANFNYAKNEDSVEPPVGVLCGSVIYCDFLCFEPSGDDDTLRPTISVIVHSSILRVGTIQGKLPGPGFSMSSQVLHV